MGNASSSAAPPVKPVAETSSRCLTKGITAAHNFEVKGFSLLEGMGVGECVSSSTFRVGGFDWNISLFPDGITASATASASAEEDKHPLSILLTPQGQGVGEECVRARFSFTVLGSNDGKVWGEFTMNHTFKSPTGIGSGWHTCKTSGFRKSLCKNNDCFTIRCVLTVIQDSRVEDASAVVVPDPSVLRDLATMLRNGDGADVTFVVGERAFPAHRCVLAARSAVFRAELFGPMKEKAAFCVWVDDMEPSVFEELLHFVYTDSLMLDDGGDDGTDRNVAMTIQHLLVAADRYGLDRLKAICEDKLCHAIDVETVATTLTLAGQHHCLQLKDYCLNFIAFASRDVLVSIIKTDGFKHLVTSCPLLLKEMLDRLEMMAAESS